MITWRVINESSSTQVTVEILQRHAWRYNSYSPLCNPSTIPMQQPMIGEGSVKCVSTCPSGLSTLGSVKVPCTGYSVSEGYAAGEGRFTFKAQRNASFVATFGGKGWFILVYSPDADWSVAVQIQTYKRPNGHYNNAPIVTMLPVYRLRRLQTYVLKINVADNDFDPYRCLWSNGTQQCGNLSGNVPGAVLHEADCYLTFTPQISGYYAVALTVQDYETLSSPLPGYLSQVPIQFIFRVYDSLDPCWNGPVYDGDLPPDMCIYLQANTKYTTRIRFRVQCTNATLTSIISVNPTGLTNSDLIQDPFDKTMFIYSVHFFASVEQYGQNLYCFSGVDSIGNQGPSACLRFIVESPSVLLNPLYTQNMSHYPVGTVPSTTSTWTILTDKVYHRPVAETYIRFKRLSDNADVFRLNVVTEVTNVLYLPDRLILTSNVAWTPGERYYIYFDSGVLALASTCTKPSMPIVEPSFWPFDIPDETTVTTTTSTSTTSVSSTLRIRTTPTQKLLIMTSIRTSTATSTIPAKSTQSEIPFTSEAPARRRVRLHTSTIVAIALGALLLLIILIKILLILLRPLLIHILLIRYGLHSQIYSLRTNQVPSFHQLDRTSQSTIHYKIKTNRRQKDHTFHNDSRSNSTASCATVTTLVEVQI